MKYLSVIKFYWLKRMIFIGIIRKVAEVLIIPPPFTTLNILFRATLYS